jgi:hypothetical protein
MSRHPRPLRPRAVTERLGAVVADQLTKDYGDGVGLDPLDLRIEVGSGWRWSVTTAPARRRS